MVLPQNSSVTGGNDPRMTGELSARRQAQPSAGTDPNQFGGGQPAAAPGMSPQQGAPGMGANPLSGLLKEALQVIVRNRFAQEDLQTVQDFVGTLQGILQQSQPAAPAGAPPAGAPPAPGA